jgi:DNA-binding HxlR family transcriptional regulator
MKATQKSAKPEQKKDYVNCGLAKTLKIIGSKWTLMILYSLFDGTKRFGELQDDLGLSPRTLALRLQQLEQDKIITKKVYAEVPPKVEYTLTEKGRSLHKVIKDLSVWGDERC